MKNFKYLLLVMLVTFMSLANVNADTITYEYLETGYGKLYSTQGYSWFNMDSFSQEFIQYSQYNLDELYKSAIEYYNDVSNEYPYYSMSVILSGTKSSGSVVSSGLMLYLNLSTSIPTVSNLRNSCSKSVQFLYNGDSYSVGDGATYCHPYSYGFDNLFNDISSDTNEGPYYNPLFYYKSNFDLVFDLDDTYVVNDYYGETLTFNKGDVISTYYDSTIASKYTEVNLDNYEYVILNLKDYAKKDAFSSNLQVKGMIGITPVYEFGTVEKETITDRCNISYTDYTDYRLYILKNDLINNSVYYIKSCEEGSSFKFDSTVFDITYVTESNKDNPIIIVGGANYNTIPFNKLSNSANQNEENNFIPGQSGDASISGVIDSITDYISSFWNSLTTFMSLVTKFFNVLPIEIRAICITTFSAACTLGLLKILKS